MASLKPTLNQADVNLLKDIFATKDDLKKNLKPLKKDIAIIKKDINEVIGNFDDSLIKHHKRLVTIENHLHLPSPNSII